MDQHYTSAATHSRKKSLGQRLKINSQLPPLVTCHSNVTSVEYGTFGPKSAALATESTCNYNKVCQEKTASQTLLKNTLGAKTRLSAAAAAAGSGTHFQMMKTFSDSAHLPSVKQNKLNASITQLSNMQYKEKALPNVSKEVQATRASGSSSTPKDKTTAATSATAQKIEQVLCPQNQTAMPKIIQHSRSGPNNHGFDDANNDYIIEIGELWDERYVVVKKLGRGSFGQVVEAYDQVHHVRLAIKIIKNRSAFYKQALVEEKVLRHLKEKDPYRHKPIVTLLRSFHQQNHLCMVYELLGINLYEVLRMTQFQGLHLNAVREIARQLLVTLQFLSRRDMRIVHCDLKPENILVCDPASSSIKVIDFGSSCFEHEKLYNYIQSRFYRAPEILLGLTYTCSIDSWSLGCVLVELLTGEPLFPGQSEAEMISGMCKTIGAPPDYLLDLACPTTQTMLRHPEVIWGIKREKVGQWFKRVKPAGATLEPRKDSKFFEDEIRLSGQAEGQHKTADYICSDDDDDEDYAEDDEDDDYEEGYYSDDLSADDVDERALSETEFPESTTFSTKQQPAYFQSAPQPNTGSEGSTGSNYGGHWVCTAPMSQKHFENSRRSTYSSSWGGPNHSMWEVLMRKMEQKERQIAASNGTNAQHIGMLDAMKSSSPAIALPGKAPTKGSVAVGTETHMPYGNVLVPISPFDWQETNQETLQMHGRLVEKGKSARGVRLFYEKTANTKLHEPFSSPECRAAMTLGHTITDFKHFYLLIKQFLQYDPLARITPEKGLQSSFFRPHNESATNTLITNIHSQKSLHK